MGKHMTVDDKVHDKADDKVDGKWRTRGCKNVDDKCSSTWATACCQAVRSSPRSTMIFAPSATWPGREGRRCEGL